MRFDASVCKHKAFSDAHDFLPHLKRIRLWTLDEQPARKNARERTWTALWDTGSPITVVPFLFIENTQWPAFGKTKTSFGSFDPNHATRKYLWYPILIGLPGLPMLKVRAIAPDDSGLPPIRRRQHITLGRDVITRLCVGWTSNIPWNDQVAATANHHWRWRYRRRLPRGVLDFRKSPEQ